MTAGEPLSSGQTTVSCYLGEVPEFVDLALSNRYETLHSSLAFFKVWRSIEHVNCYVAWRDGLAQEVLLFSCERRQVSVLNEMIEVAPAELQRFTDYIFENFPEADLIRFNAIDTITVGLGFPAQRYNAKDNFLVSLPATPDEYLAGLGKSTRANLRSRINNIRKNFPSFTSTRFVNEAISEAVIREIVRLSEHRIRDKGVHHKHDVDRILALSKTCGFVVVLSIDGRMCAGSINYRIGASIFGEVTAHDPAYERHGLGALCVYYTACEAIKAGARKFYLGGGVFGFKGRMLGKRIDMDQLQIYRSHTRLLANLDRAALAFAHGQLRRLKNTLHENKGTFPVDFIFSMFHALKNKAGK